MMPPCLISGRWQAVASLHGAGESFKATREVLAINTVIEANMMKLFVAKNRLIFVGLKDLTKVELVMLQVL